MGKTFGNTWWGMQWLNALSNIDYDNRIPRGKTYANNGYVQKIQLKGNIINAKVRGSRPRPYSVMIVVPPFFPEDVDRLMDRLVTHPGVISGLMARELDPEILNIAEDCGLKIFPQKWTDFKMQCSCPDWAVPCKHIAAVIYMLSREIDNNPFLVFEMHNVFLFDELKKRGIDVDEVRGKAEVPIIGSIVRRKTAREVIRDVPQFRKIDFSRIGNCRDALLMLLQDNPTFDTGGNFRDTYVSETGRIMRNAQRFFAGKLAPEGLFPGIACIDKFDTDTEVGINFDNVLDWEIVNIPGLNPGKCHCLLDAETLGPALLGVNPDFLADYHPNTIGLYQSLLFSLHLLASGSFAPEVLALADGTYAVRWIPAYTGDRIKEIVRELDDIIPDGAIKFKANAKSAAKFIHGKAEWIISFFLGQLIGNLSASCTGNDMAQFFFKGVHLPFSEVGEKEIPGKIKAWTSVFSFSESVYRPVMSVEENPDGGFDMHVAVEDKENAESLPVPLCSVLNDCRYERERFNILRSFTLISHMIADIGAYINLGAEKPLHYTEQQFVPLLMQIIPAARMLDMKVFLPKSLQTLLRPRPSLNISRKQEKGKTFLRLDDLLSFDWEVAIGDEIISVDEFRRLQDKASGLIRFRQKYIYVDADDMQRLQKAFMAENRMSPARLLQTVILEEYDSAPVRISDDVRMMLKELTDQKDIPLPSGLNAVLRPYQERGFAWMYKNMKIGFGSILADDMGLGKTLQAITLMLKLKEDGVIPGRPALVVAPTGLVTNWEAEIGRFAPSLKAFVYHGGNRQLKDFCGDVLITTYGIVRSDTAKLKKIEWSAMFIDEAQNIKNHNTAQSKAVCSIPADVHVALSGTPVENRLSEFWSIMEYANEGYLDTLKAFNERFAKPIQLYNDEECAMRFRKITAPFMMRRLKTDKNIINDLPDKIERNEYASLKGGQAALYHQTLEAAMNEIEDVPTTDSQSLFKRQGLILQMILALKQICNHPAQFLKDGDSRVELSGKAEMLVDLVESIVESGEKVLVFTQFREMGDILVNLVEERLGTRPLFYHGGCSVKSRQEMVSRFQNTKSDKVFILSLKAAGTGLNLTAASHVIHYDLWWNPAVEAQATDRAYRIGQQKNVMVHRFITKDTFEEKIDMMIQQKRHLAEMTVASGESWIGKLSNKELRELFE